MPSKTGKNRRVTNLKRERKARAAGKDRKRKASKKSTASYAELFGETKAEFDAKFAAKGK